MKSRLVTLAAMILAAGATCPAPAATMATPVHAMFSKTKMVKLSLRNDSGAPVRVKAGDTSMTLNPGKPETLKLAEGTAITVEEATPTHAAGALIAQVSTSLQGATIVIH